jgi:DNA ligase (NAD+)
MFPFILKKKKAQDLAISMGAKATPTSISRLTNLLVVGKNGGLKVSKAKEFNITVVDSNEFLKMVKESKSGKSD